jgi:cobyrinic acid a,c-diamide synthase
MASRTVPALLLAGTHRGCGKTTFATGLMAAWRKRGLTVQPFKIGADALEPVPRTGGRPASIVLDLWTVPSAGDLLRGGVGGADIPVPDGARGL